MLRGVHGALGVPLAFGDQAAERPVIGRAVSRNVFWPCRKSLANLFSRFAVQRACRTFLLSEFSVKPRGVTGLIQGVGDRDESKHTQAEWQ